MMIVMHLIDMRMQSILPILPIVVFEILEVVRGKTLVRMLGVLNQRLMMAMSWYYVFVSLRCVLSVVVGTSVVEFV